MGVGGGMMVITYTTKEDASEVAGSEMADEFEVAEMEAAVWGEVCGGVNGGPVWIVLSVGSGDVRVVVVWWGGSGGDAVVEA